ncbi:MAG: O-antigen ligase C-terminal domain-containing protein [Methylibium sp.]|uniref:PglL family O-oligosaccharyltransferase n=1 Tax=Methylibium sp. TaxID=2067992 RepID=UPI00183BBC71|nr:O-antigen ligase family protein [Methylibium sp.]MBA3599021.1 O-antigen ligase C-terminal domain-containing protein [Methylibium sp.]
MPDSVFFNQLAAVFGWGAWLLMRGAGSARVNTQKKAAMLAASLALGVCAFFAAMRIGVGQGSAALVLLAALAVLWSGVRSGPADARAIALAWWLAGLLSVAVAVLQYFAPGLAEGWLVAANATPGRAVGNLRQPNHLATALLCAMVMTAWLWQAGRLRPGLAAASIAALVFAVALSASRTGALALAVLLVWAVLDRSQPRALRWTLATTPLLYLACWAALAAYAQVQDASFFASERLDAGGDISSSRFAIWRNALALIAQQPWTGVGWGNFNFAWTFTPFPDRPVAFFDHTHSLPLQLAVEIGVPATLAVLGLLGWALWRARAVLQTPTPLVAPSNVAAARTAPSAPPTTITTEVAAVRRGAPPLVSDFPCAPPSIARAALAMLAVLALHSLLEYPLWYAYFLLPAAWTLGAFLGAAPARADESAAKGRNTRASSAALRGAGLLMLLGAAWAAWDHRRIEVIFAPPAGAGTLEARIAEGRQSWLFGHHADYAAATTPPSEPSLAAFRRPLHMLVDTRLLIAYIEALHTAGRDAEALYAAQRLREFRRPDAQVYFKACTPDNAAPPFQCETKPVALTWRELKP